MIGDKRVLTLVPARAGSKGMPGKNIEPLMGKPLLAWPIEAALASGYVDRVVLSTDSEEYADIGRAHGADVPFLRPAEFANDTAPSISFIRHALTFLAAEGDHYDYLVLMEPTSPLTEAGDIDGALEAMEAARADGMTAAVSVTALETQHPAFAVRRDEATKKITPLAPGGFGNLPRRQDLEPIFALDGSFYISTTQALFDHDGFCHDHTIGIPTSREKSLEVDDLIDFLCIQSVLQHREMLQADNGAS